MDTKKEISFIPIIENIDDIKEFYKKYKDDLKINLNLNEIEEENFLKSKENLEQLNKLVYVIKQYNNTVRSINIVNNLDFCNNELEQNSKNLKEKIDNEEKRYIDNLSVVENIKNTIDIMKEEECKLDLEYEDNRKKIDNLREMRNEYDLMGRNPENSVFDKLDYLRIETNLEKYLKKEAELEKKIGANWRQMNELEKTHKIETSPDAWVQLKNKFSKVLKLTKEEDFGYSKDKLKEIKEKKADFFIQKDNIDKKISKLIELNNNKAKVEEKSLVEKGFNVSDVKNIKKPQRSIDEIMNNTLSEYEKGMNKNYLDQLLIKKSDKYIDILKVISSNISNKTKDVYNTFLFTNLEQNEFKENKAAVKLGLSVTQGCKNYLKKMTENKVVAGLTILGAIASFNNYLPKETAFEVVYAITLINTSFKFFGISGVPVVSTFSKPKINELKEATDIICDNIPNHRFSPLELENKVKNYNEHFKRLNNTENITIQKDSKCQDL